MTALDMNQALFAPALDDDAELIAFLDERILRAQEQRDQITIGSDAYTNDPNKVRTVRSCDYLLKNYRALKRKLA